MSKLLSYSNLLQRENYYEASVQRPPVGSILQASLQADVLVIGAGFAGLTAAIDLAKQGFKVVVLEAGQICSGASGRNGGQTLVGVASGQQVLEKQLGLTEARKIWVLSIEAIRLLDKRIAEHGIDCDRVHGSLTVAESTRKAKALLKDAQWLQDKYGL